MRQIRFDDQVVLTTWGNPWFPHGPPPSEPSLPPLPQRSRPFVLSGPPLPLVTEPPAGQSPAPAAIRSDPTWVSELEPEQVVPGVLFLASDRCTFSGKVLEAAGGEFDVARWASSECKRTIPERVERKSASEQCLKRPSRRRQELEIEGLINV